VDFDEHSTATEYLTMYCALPAHRWPGIYYLFVPQCKIGILAIMNYSRSRIPFFVQTFD
jgi:hypothetical protein